MQLSVIDVAAEPLLPVRQQEREGCAFAVFEVDADRVAALGEANVGDDRSRAQVVAAFGDGDEAGVDDIGGSGMFVVRVRAGGNHPGVAVAADDDGIREELAVFGELLREPESGFDERVEVPLRAG